jgi:hypothetical protein
MLQSLLGSFGAGFVLPFLADGHPMHDHLADQSKVAAADAQADRPDYTPEFLDRHQLETLAALAERIIPGSTTARVAPFLDSLLSVSVAASQRRLVSSLGAFEMLAIERHQRPWKALSASQQDELLTHASTAPSGQAPLPSGGGSRGATPAAGRLTIRDFFDDLRGWISGAYYSSEIGMRELGWTGQMMFDKLPGCEHPGGHRDEP